MLNHKVENNSEMVLKEIKPVVANLNKNKTK